MPKTLSDTALDARAELRRIAPPGTEIYLVLEHVARSGMTRLIKPYVFKPETNSDGETSIHTYWLASLFERADFGFKRRRTSGQYGYVYSDGLVVGGCGMDMGFHLVYECSAQLFRDEADSRHECGYQWKHRWL